VAIVTITGLLAFRMIEPPVPFDAAGRLSVNEPLFAPDAAVGAGEGLDGVPGVGTDLDEVHAETMPLSATKVTRMYIRPRITAALLASGCKPQNVRSTAKSKWDLRFTVCPRRRRKTAQHQVPRLAVPPYA
jgi:hypothetical protein